MNLKTNHNSQRGWGMIGVMIVVLIILVLTIMMFNGGNWLGGPTPTTNAIDRELDSLDEMNQQNLGFTDQNVQQAIAEKRAKEEAERQKQQAEAQEQQPANPLQAVQSMQTTAGGAPAPGPEPGMLGNIGRARRLSTSVNTQTLNTNLQMWKLSHPDQPVTIENLRKTGFSFPPLKPNQEYVIVNDNIYINTK
ncbi:hypothetical protein JXA32_13905 [Candidatus Sumerlaeota bacterium]|nr:hypothetical protein [Candidatus Sumerlaeota bacterium]